MPGNTIHAKQNSKKRYKITEVNFTRGKWEHAFQMQRRHAEEWEVWDVEKKKKKNLLDLSLLLEK